MPQKTFWAPFGPFRAKIGPFLHHNMYSHSTRVFTKEVRCRSDVVVDKAEDSEKLEMRREKNYGNG